MREWSRMWIMGSLQLNRILNNTVRSKQSPRENLLEQLVIIGSSMFHLDCLTLSFSNSSKSKEWNRCFSVCIHWKIQKTFCIIRCLSKFGAIYQPFFEHLFDIQQLKVQSFLEKSKDDKQASQGNMGHHPSNVWSGQCGDIAILDGLKATSVSCCITYRHLRVIW